MLSFYNPYYFDSVFDTKEIPVEQGCHFDLSVDGEKSPKQVVLSRGDFSSFVVEMTFSTFQEASPSVVLRVWRHPKRAG